MFFSNVLAASIMAFTASAAPLAARQFSESTSTGIRLVVSVSGADFPDAPVQGLAITAAHTGAGINRAIADSAEGSIFYSNGTDAQAESWTAHLINDTPTFPQGFVIMFEGSGGATGTQFEVEISAQQDATRVPSDGMQVSKSGPAFIDPLGASDVSASTATFVVCKSTLPNNGETVFNTLHWLVSSQIPQDCVAVHLVPECATLADVPAGGAWNHDFARESRCYTDAKSVVISA